MSTKMSQRFALINGNRSRIHNISVGGMLLDSSTKGEIGTQMPITITIEINGRQFVGRQFVVHGEIIRAQERSVAVRFSKVSKRQQSFLKKLHCVPIRF